MSQYPHQQPPPLPSDPPRQPSLAAPILLTAVAAAIMFSLPSILSNVLGTSSFGCCAQNCTASFFAATLGFMPVMMFKRLGGYPTAGLGCLLGWLAVGIGGIAGAIVQAKFPVHDTDELRKLFGQMYDEAERELSNSGQSMPANRDEFIASGIDWAPYFVLIVAFLSSLLAGLFGLLAASMGRRPQPPQHPHYPQYPHPPQPPPPPPQV